MNRTKPTTTTKCWFCPVHPVLPVQNEEHLREMPPKPAPLQRQTLTGMTLGAIRERILHGTYPEGEPLRQDAIAAELGVSRVPIREALRQLEAEGLVTFTPHRGAVVSSLSLDEIDEIFALRADIESDLLRRAIPRLGADALARAAEVLDRYERALTVH